MPCFRGLGVSISVQPRSERLPEFPHPDGSSVRVLLSPDSPSSADNKRSSISTLDSGRLQKANPRVSVYIPSTPGSQFMVEYDVLRMPEPACQFYFKLFINGRHITSWGIDPIHEACGIISRALYEPCERWHYEQDGTMFRTEGIESRSFFFSPSLSHASFADDGGLIEVHAYRARGRRRRAVRPERFRSQDRYGIVSPSGGLLERPEATTYFDWDLVDHKDSPFASFRFHYRDWNTLNQLSLIPSESQNLTDSYPLSSTVQESPRVENSDGYLAESFGDRKIWVPDSSRTPTPLIFWHAAAPGVRGAKEPASLNSNQRPASGDAAVRSSSRHFSRSRSVSGADASDASRLSRNSMESLAASTAPSIAPSLLPYIEDSSYESSAEFGTAVGLELRNKALNGASNQRALPAIPTSRPHYEKAGATAQELHPGGIELPASISSLRLDEGSGVRSTHKSYEDEEEAAFF